MVAEIRSIFGHPIIPEAPSQRVIDELKTLLEMAERGEIKALAFAYVGGSIGGVGTGWNGEDGTPPALLIGITALKRSFESFVLD